MIDVPQSRETFAERSANYNTLRSWGISQILKKSKEINQKGEKIYKMTKEAQGILNKILISTK